LILFVQGLGGVWGSEVAADFLVFTAVVWNIWIGIYQAFKTVPGHLLEVCNNYNFGFLKIMRFLYVPFSMPRIAGNIFPSFANALFFITVSEVFTVGTSAYQTFGIGALIAQTTAQGDFGSLYYSLMFLAIGVVGITLLFSRFSKEVVAKYGIDTTPEIKRRAGYFRGHRLKLFEIARRRTSVMMPKLAPKMPRGNVGATHGTAPRTLSGRLLTVERGLALKATAKYTTLAVVGAGLIFVLYSLLVLMFSVPGEQWGTYLALTPSLLYAMAIDYARVLLVTVIAVVIAIFLGYYLLMHRKAVPFSLPVIQTVGAFPAPVYFPLLFAATLPFLQGSFGEGASTEMYVLLLSFLSVFYYAIFNFWVGLQLIPSEFWDIMRTYQLPFFTRLRRIILPATFPFMISAISTTINSAWGGLAVAEYWPRISGERSLEVNVGMMKVITSNTANGHLDIAAWTSLLFAIVVVIFGILFTRKLMDVARKRYVVEEGIYQA
jgi:NitT/TauT family transport system permease protein